MTGAFMSYACVYSRACYGMSAPLISVEVHLSSGLPNFSIVGLPEKALKESKDRVRSAILNSHFDFPMQRITVNLAPADLPKQGGRFDLAIALGILVASQQVKATDLPDYEFAGELALDGHLRPIKAALPFAIATQQAKRKLIVALENSDEVKLARNLPAFSAQSLLEVCAHLQNHSLLPSILSDVSAAAFIPQKDLSEVKGQVQGKRALEIAALGNHSILFYGPPGTGKTMLAQRLMSIMPELNEAEALEVAAIYSLSRGKFEASQWRQRPFRSPHHSASSVAMVGGGRPVQPGEISLAHHGVLFLDEFPEFNRSVLEALREPLEAGLITISRANSQAQYPAQFQLIAAMNPCPCGYFGDRQRKCQCSFEQIKKYETKVSGPLLDRIDLHVVMPRISSSQLYDNEITEPSSVVRQRVMAARQESLSPELIAESQQFLAATAEKLQLSMRAQGRILRVARTIARLERSAYIESNHIAEAFSFRKPDKIGYT